MGSIDIDSADSSEKCIYMKRIKEPLFLTLGWVEH